MKKKLLFFFWMYFSFILCVYASSGALKKNSIKTCPNGVTYGYHAKDKHWHVAERSNTSSGWSAVGDAFYYDPCPNDSSSVSSTPNPTPPQNEESSHEIQQPSNPQNTQKEVSSSEENTEEISPPISKEKEESTEIDGSNHSILGKNNESQNELKEDFDSVSEENNNTSSEIIDEQHANLVDSSIEEETESSWNDSNPGPGFILLLPAYIWYRVYKKKK